MKNEYVQPYNSISTDAFSILDDPDPITFDSDTRQRK